MKNITDFLIIEDEKILNEEDLEKKAIRLKKDIEIFYGWLELVNLPRKDIEYAVQSIMTSMHRIDHIEHRLGFRIK